jgi:hypothetical protein
MFGSRRVQGHRAGFRRWAVVTASVIGFGAALAIANPAFAGSDRAAGKVRRITFETASGPPVPFAQTCDSTGACLIPISGGPASTVTGDFDGTGVYAGAARPVGSDEAYSSAITTFTGSVKGCGTGTEIMRYDAHYAADLPHGGGGTWEIVDGTGTGDLEQLSGHGTFTIDTVDPADFSGTNSFKGTIRC